MHETQVRTHQGRVQDFWNVGLYVGEGLGGGGSLF